MPPKADGGSQKPGSQAKKKVSVLKDSFMFEVVEAICDELKKPGTFVKIAKTDLKRLRSELADLRRSDEESPPELLQQIVPLLDKTPASCRRLRPDAFAAIVEVLAHAGKQDLRSRGLFLLANSIYLESRDDSSSTGLENRVTLIGQGCLLTLFESFCKKDEHFECRLWSGVLVLQLITYSEDNHAIIDLMPEGKRTVLGQMVLYESSEILRSVAGRAMTILIEAECVPKRLFPSDTDADLFSDYPSDVPASSQWDKTFQEYIDSIWESINAHSHSTVELKFAQNLRTIPQYSDIEFDPSSHRTIYVEIADSLRLYMHSEDETVALLIDIPYSSISAIKVDETVLDGSLPDLPNPPADVSFHLRGMSHVMANSAEADISEVRLTVKDRPEAEELLQAVGKLSASMMAGKDPQAQASKKATRTNSQESNVSKVSVLEDALELGGDYDSRSMDGASAKVISSPVQATGRGNPVITNADDDVTVVEDSYKRDDHVLPSDEEELLSLSQLAVKNAVAAKDSSGQLAGPGIADPLQDSGIVGRPEPKADIPLPSKPATFTQKRPKTNIPEPLKVPDNKPAQQDDDIYEFESSSPQPRKVGGAGANANKAVGGKAKTYGAKAKLRSKAPVKVFKQGTKPAAKASKPTQKPKRVEKNVDKPSVAAKSPPRASLARQKKNVKSMKESSDSEDDENQDDVGASNPVTTSTGKSESKTTQALAATKLLQHNEGSVEGSFATFDDPMMEQDYVSRAGNTPQKDLPELKGTQLQRKSTKPLDDSPAELPSSIDHDVFSESADLGAEKRFPHARQRTDRKPAANGASAEDGIARRMASIFQKAAVRSKVGEKETVATLGAQDGADYTGIDDLGGPPSNLLSEALSQPDDRTSRRDSSPLLVLDEPPPLRTMHISKDVGNHPNTAKPDQKPARMVAPKKRTAILLTDIDEVDGYIEETSKAPFSKKTLFNRQRKVAAVTSDGKVAAAKERGPSPARNKRKPVASRSASKPENNKVELAHTPVSKQHQEIPGSSAAPILVDEYLARKTPLVAFGKHGPKNQGLSSASKQSATKPPVAKTVAVKSIDKPSVTAVSKRVEPRKVFPRQDHVGNKKRPLEVETSTIEKESQTKRKRPTTKVITHPATKINVRKDLPPQTTNVSPVGMIQRSESSLSRVDYNGSPRINRRATARNPALDKSNLDLNGSTLAFMGSYGTSSPLFGSQDDDDDDFIPVEENSLSAGSNFYAVSSNHKTKPHDPNHDTSFEERYTPHHSIENGNFVDLAKENILVAQPSAKNPFALTEKRRTSDFARRLVQEKAEKRLTELTPSLLAETAAPASKTTVLPKHLFRPLVSPRADPDKTLVEPAPQLNLESAEALEKFEYSSFTDTASDQSEEDDEPEEQSSEERWRAALKPYQKDLANMLHYSVEILLQQLFDKEEAVERMAPQFLRDGGQVIESLKDRIKVDRKKLHSKAATSMQKSVLELGASRSAAESAAAPNKSLEKRYADWRSRQHNLQRMLNMNKMG